MYTSYYYLSVSVLRCMVNWRSCKEEEDVYLRVVLVVKNQFFAYIIITFFRVFILASWLI